MPDSITPTASIEAHMSPLPLCVDLDGTLLRTDALFESLLALLAKSPLCLFLLPLWLLRGKAALKREIAMRAMLNPERLPYDERLLTLLRGTTARPRVLCTASDESIATSIAEHLGCFEVVIASDGKRNLSGHRKAESLIERFGERGFDYAGNAAIDLRVWDRARGGWVVNADEGLHQAALKRCEIHGYWPDQGNPLKRWLKAMRLHQWLKNLLVFVPLLAAHQFFDPASAMRATIAFLAFGLCASGVYLLNDLLDLESDRAHPRKRRRPFAAGELPVVQGMLMAPLMTLAGFVLAWFCGPLLAAVLGAYYVITLAYSLRLKRVVMVDVVVLAGLYTVRIIGGAAAIGAEPSFWLLAFSMFIFLSLAMLKRYTELVALSTEGRTEASGRGYGVEDLSLIQSLGGASGFIAVLVACLYINSETSTALYRHPQFLWLLCPMLLYWISRAWLIAHRGQMHDDPIVFAASDRVSLALVGVGAVIAYLAI